MGDRLRLGVGEAVILGQFREAEVENFDQSVRPDDYIVGL